MAGDEEEPVVQFRKVKRKKAGGVRSRPKATDNDSGEEDKVTVVRNKRADKKVNSFATNTKRTQGEVESSQLKHLNYAASAKMISGKDADSRATASNEMDTDVKNDRQAQWERAKQEAEQEMAFAAGESSFDPSSEGLGEKKEGPRSVYKGKHSYSTGLKRAVAYNAGGKAKGPLRASQSIRVTCRFDYQPDICKDYKQTGYCGYGDSCKFMHDRGDYKRGWELEQEWDAEQKQKQKKLRGEAVEEDSDYEVSSDDDELPFACFICREPFELKTNPVVTKCKHYFCEKCAFKQFDKTPKCFVCEEPTAGIFNSATLIIERLKKQAAADAEEEALGDGTMQVGGMAIKIKSSSTDKGTSGGFGGWSDA